MIHGSRTTFQSGCTCDPCREANSRYLKRYRHRIETGESPLVDASEAAAHLRTLKQQLISYNRMSFLSGIPEKGLSDLARGAVKRTTQERIDKIMKIRPDFRPDRDKPRERTYALGSIRRVRSLVRVGYTTRELERVTGVNKAILSKFLNFKRRNRRHRPTTSRQTHERIKHAFETLSHHGPTPTTPRDRVYYEANIRRGKSMGWPVPGMWENPDNPNEHHSETHAISEE